MEPASGVPIERLLEHREWVRRLARALVREESRADDVEQDAWLAAMRHPPQHDAGIKSWLRRLVRHRAANARRSATRRGAHEQLTPPPPPPRRPDDAVAQIEETERVARAVLSLEQPYRTAIALRFYEQLEPREIAARTGEPVETVRTRIKRALVKLRERLDEEHSGDGRAWCTALLPLAAGATHAKASLVTGGIAVTTKTKLTLAAAVLLVLALGASVTLTPLWRRSGPSHEVASSNDAAAALATHKTARADAKPAADTLPAAPAGTGAIVGAVRFGQTKKPAPGQRVTLATPGFAVAETTTDGAGRFRFEQLAESLPWRVEVAADGFARFVRPNVRLERTEVRDIGVLWLDAPAHLDVVVKDWGDRPVAGAAVELQPDFERGLTFDSWTTAAVLRHVAEPLATGTTDAKGRANFALPSGLRVIAVVRAKGFALTWWQGLAPTSDGFGGDVLIRLDRGERVEGRVLRADRTPAPGIAVFANNGGGYYGAAFIPRTTTGADGKFAIDHVPRGDIRLLVGAPGLPPADVALVRVPTGAPVEIVLDGKVVEGRVLSVEDGAPLPGTRVRLMQFGKDDRAIPVVEAVTDEDGRYRLDTICDGSLATFRVERPGYAVFAENPAGGLEFRNGLATRDFRLQRGAPVAGKVTGPAGPVAGARIAASWSCGPGGLARVEGFTGDDGRFALDGIAPGTVVVAATSDAGFQSGLGTNWLSELFRSQKPAGALDVPQVGLADVAITLVPGVTVTGRVEDAQGAAVGSAFVQSGWTSVRTADDGSFRMAVDPRSGVATLVATKERRTSPSVNVATDRPTENVVLRLVPPVRFVGRVATADGTAAEAASVQVIYLPASRQRYGSDEVQWTRVPVVDGRYEAEISLQVGLEGRVRMRASAPGFSPADSAPIALPFDRAEYATDLQLAPSRPLEGRVVSSADRDAVAGARISILPPSWVPDANDRTPRALGAVCDAEGRFRMDEVANGDLKIEVTHDAFVRTVVPVKAPAEDLLIEIEPAQEIAGFVHVAGGAAIAKATITCHRENDDRPDNWRYTSTGADGRFRIGGLASGTYVVSVTQPRDGSASARPREQMGVAAGTKDLDVAMEAAQQIAGRVVDSAGKPVAECSVQALSETGERYTPSDRTKDDGTFCVRGLGAGPYALIARPPEGTRLMPAKVAGVTSGANGVEIRLSEGESIRGRLVNTSGAAVAGATIDAEPCEGTGDPWLGVRALSGRTDESGAFALTGLAPGRWRLLQVIDKSVLGGVRPLRGGEDVPSGAVDVRLVAGDVATISGTVVDEDGRPIEGVRISATPVGGGPRTGARTDAKGAFVIANASDLVRYALVTSVKELPPAFATDVAPGSTGIVIKVARARETSGRVLLADGTPYANGYIEFALEGSEWRGSSKTDADGRFAENALPDGVLRVREMFLTRRYGERMTPRDCGTIRTGDKDVVLKFTE